MSRYFDSHCHLDSEAFDDDAGIDGAVQRALEAGVSRMVCIGAGYGPACAERAIAVAERHPEVWAAVGVHPHDAKHWSPDMERVMRSAAEHARVVALGEMGLDFFYDNSPRDAQRQALRAQIRLSLELAMPIVIHDRESNGETLDILVQEDAFAGRGLVFHCFTGDVLMMDRIVELGGYISIPGIVTFKNAGQMREVARRVPLERLFVETDSPFLTPAPYRGKRNEPARVVHVVEAIAALRDNAPDAVASASWANASTFYGIES